MLEVHRTVETGGSFKSTRLKEINWAFYGNMDPSRTKKTAAFSWISFTEAEVPMHAVAHLGQS